MNNLAEFTKVKKENIIYCFTCITLGTSLFSQGIAIVIGLFFASLCFVLKFNMHKDRIFFALLGFLVFTLFFGLLNNSNLVLVSEELLRNLFYILLYSIFIQNLSDMRLESIFKLFSKLIIVSIFLYPFLLYNGRFSSIFPHPNHLAYLCNLLIAYFLLFSDTSLRKIKFYVLSLLVAIFLSESSGGIISTLITVLLYFFRNSFSKFIITSIGIFLIFILLKEAPVISLIIEKLASVQLDEIEERASTLAFGNDTSLVWRLTYWYAILEGLNDFSSYKQIFGLGIGTMSYQNYYFSWMITDPHNDYVRIIAETGFLGASIYFTLWVFIIIRLNLKSFFLPIFFIPMLVGNILVNVTFMISMLMLVRLLRRR